MFWLIHGSWFRSHPRSFNINSCKKILKLTFNLSKNRIRYHRKQWNEGQQAKVRREHPRLVKRLLENSVKYRNLTNTVKRWLFGKAIGVPAKTINLYAILNVHYLWISFQSCVCRFRRPGERSSIEPELLLDTLRSKGATGAIERHLKSQFAFFQS